MKSIWVQQLQNGIKETYESARKFAASKKNDKNSLYRVFRNNRNGDFLS